MYTVNTIHPVNSIKSIFCKEEETAAIELSRRQGNPLHNTEIDRLSDSGEWDDSVNKCEEC